MSHLIFTFSITSLCYQGKGSVEKETEVKLLSVKDLKDSGIEARVTTSLIELFLTLWVISFSPFQSLLSVIRVTDTSRRKPRWSSLVWKIWRRKASRQASWVPTSLITLLVTLCHLTFTLSIISLCCQGTGSVKKETEVKLLGVKDSKDNGVEARVLTCLISLLFTLSVISL